MKPNITDTKQFNHRPIVYLVYNYLKKECKGYNNRQKSYTIMKEFDISNNEKFREIVKTIRQSDTLMKFVGSEAGSNGGYWIATNENEVHMTLQHLLLRAFEMLKTYSILRRKSRLNNQRRLKLRAYEKEVYESLMEEEDVTI